jgi:putative membrane protein
MTRNTRHLVSTIAAAVAMIAMPTWAQTTSFGKADNTTLVKVAQANIAEVEAGKLALEKSQNPEVKKFAQMMVDDHGKALKDVQALATSKSVSLPSEPDAKHKAAIAKLKAAKGSTFDTQYIKRAGLSDHEATDRLLKMTSLHAKDADLKALAGKMLPVVESHLQHAREMSKMKM